MRFVVEKPIFKAFAVVAACAALVVAMQAHLLAARGDLTCLHPRWALLLRSVQAARAAYLGNCGVGHHSIDLVDEFGSRGAWHGA